jgi:hypothetical protein
MCNLLLSNRVFTFISLVCNFNSWFESYKDNKQMEYLPDNISLQQFVKRLSQTEVLSDTSCTAHFALKISHRKEANEIKQARRRSPPRCCNGWKGNTENRQYNTQPRHTLKPRVKGDQAELTRHRKLNTNVAKYFGRISYLINGKLNITMIKWVVEKEGKVIN